MEHRIHRPRRHSSLFRSRVDGRPSAEKSEQRQLEGHLRAEGPRGGAEGPRDGCGRSQESEGTFRREMAAECCVRLSQCGRSGGFWETFRKKVADLPQTVVDLPRGKQCRGGWKAVYARKVPGVNEEGPGVDAESLKKEWGPSAGKWPLSAV